MQYSPNLSVGIIAGGKSTRMGTDKALLAFGGICLLEKIAKELSCFSEVMISAAQKGKYESFGYPMVYDENLGIGPMEGVRKVLLHAKEPYVFVCATDLPNVSREMVQYLSQYVCSDYDCIAFQDEDHVHPLCAIYSKQALPVLEEMIKEGNYRMRSLLKRVRTKYVTLENTCFGRRSLINVNDKNSLIEALKPFVFCVSGYSDSGKTTLIEGLIPLFRKDGFNVGVIKHDGHDAIRDALGSDTDRFWQAGAACTVAFSKSSHTLRMKGEISADELIRGLRSLDHCPDVIILEGLKDSCFPKVEIIRKEIYDKSVCNAKTLLCIASDVDFQNEMPCPVYDPKDTDGIYQCIRQRLSIP